MRVIISVGGRFHAFFLARQLWQRDALEKLITSYPRSAAREYGIPAEKVRALVGKEVLFRIWRRLPAVLRSGYDLRFWAGELFDRQASREITACDLFIGWSGFSLRALRRARALGAVTILQRGSTHIVYQREILRREFARLGITPNLPSERTVEKELAEYGEADYIEVPSSFARRTFEEQGVAPSRIIQAGRGVDLSRFRPVPKEDDVFRIIYAGRLSIRKGVHCLLEAFSALGLAKAELWLIGDLSDEIRPFLKEYNGSFKWLGGKRESELSRYYSQGSVFVLPSLEEGLAMVQVQAMACGLPVISTPNAGAEDIIEEGREGFIIPAGDVEALKDKISRLYLDPALCRRLGRAAREKALRSHSWEDYGEMIFRLYQKLVGVGAGGDDAADPGKPGGQRAPRIEVRR